MHLSVAFGTAFLLLLRTTQQRGSLAKAHSLWKAKDRFEVRAMTGALVRKARLPPQDRVSEILAAARTELADCGYENFLPAAVAARCGVSEATIYRYFPTKRELLAKVAEDWFGEILAVEPEIARRSNAYDQLRHLIRHSLGVVRREPALTRFVLTELRADPAYRSTRIYALNRRFTSSVINLVKDGVARGVFRPKISPSLVRDMIFGCIEHRTWGFLRGQGDFSVDEVADSIADIVFHGLARRPSPDPDAVAAALGALQAKTKELEGAVDGVAAALRAPGTTKGA
jgi:TetR/AcrR family transcriptional regulator, fatty acid metabolism regulator protein